MKKQKIRGIKRRHRAIEKWIDNNLALRYDLLKTYNEDHCDIVVHPWCDLSLINSIIPRPKGKTKLLMIQGLVKIYNAWKEQAININKSYYLKIWLFTPRFELSRVVCAVDESKDFYSKSLQKADIKNLPANLFTSAHLSLADFSWQRKPDNTYYSNNDLGNKEDYISNQDYLESEKWFTKLLKSPHTTIPSENLTGDMSNTYCFTRGDIWIGGIG